MKSRGATIFIITALIISALSLSPAGLAYAVAAPPVITGISPTYGVVGSTVTIDGTDFGLGRRKHVDYVYFGNVVVPVKAWSDTRITVAVPNMFLGQYAVKVITAAGVSNTMNFQVIQAPSISSIMPSSGSAGSQIQLLGSGFSFNTRQVNFSTAGTTRPASFTVAGNNIIDATVPAVLPGYYNVQVVTDGGISNGKTFLVTTQTAAIITSIQPSSGPVGVLVKIIGSSFGTTRSTSQVVFGDIPVTSYYLWTNTSIQCFVPVLLPGSYAVTVVKQSGASNPMIFTVVS